MMNHNVAEWILYFSRFVKIDNLDQKIGMLKNSNQTRLIKTFTYIEQHLNNNDNISNNGRMILIEVLGEGKINDEEK